MKCLKIWILKTSTQMKKEVERKTRKNNMKNQEEEDAKLNDVS